MAFLACLKAGIIAVPVFPPHPARKDTLVMFTKIVQECGAVFALTNSSYSHLKKLASLKDALSRFSSKKNTDASWPDDLTWIVTDTMQNGGSRWGRSKTPQLPTPDKSDLAFLQFTSGSTSAPKGVMITHGNLADNLEKITAELEASQDTVVVSWLPQYHDMGLIGSYLGILYCGGNGYYMSPLTFLQRPMMWIEAVSRFRGTHLQAPNFALKLTARKFDKSKYTSVDSKSLALVLDLASVKHIINAAEPVTEDSIDAFCEAFCPYGLDKRVIYPTYGLAEHTVFVCSGGKQRLTVSKHALEVDGVVKLLADGSNNSDLTSRLIGCGFPSKQNVDVKIVSTDTYQALSENQVGEIWIRSDSKASGYYKKPFESKRDFCAVIGQAPPTEDNGEVVDIASGYLKTGDLGFLHRGELFICGRIKDLIIVGGRNYYPQDLEATAEDSDKRIRPGCSAAFTVDPISGSDEEVALIFELREVPDTKVCALFLICTILYCHLLFDSLKTFIPSPMQLKDVESMCSGLVKALKGSIMQEHSLALSHVVILRPRTIPKTTSGKIARAWCRKAFMNKTLNSIYSTSFSNNQQESNGSSRVVNGPRQRAVDPQTIRSMEKSEILSKLKADISNIVSIPATSISTNSDLATMMDSLSLSQFKGQLEVQYATTLSDEYLFREGSTINKLVEVVKLGYAPDDNEENGAGSSSPPAAAGSAGGVAGALGCPPGVCCTVM